MPTGETKSYGHHNLPFDTKIWILLMDKENRYYLQNPPVRLERDGTWSQHHIILGPDLVRIIAVQVTLHGNSEFETRVKRSGWGPFRRLPMCSTELALVKIETPAD